MAEPPTHSWSLSAAEAISLQKELAAGVVREDRFAAIRHVAGLDVGFEADGTVARAAAVVLGFPGLEVVDRAIARRPVDFPYVPGLLSFREVPVLLEALDRLTVSPDLLLCDGQGVAHPRRFGLACHIGVLRGLPAIGVGKSRLVGGHHEPGDRRGDWEPLVHRGEVVGAALRSRPGCKPIYVSTGHRISLETAIATVMRCVTRYRLPETTRAADRLSKGR